MDVFEQDKQGNRQRQMDTETDSKDKRQTS